jgi:hypothetical protein
MEMGMEEPCAGINRLGGGDGKAVRRDKPAWRRRWKSSTPKE